MLSSLLGHPAATNATPEWLARQALGMLLSADAEGPSVVVVDRLLL